MHAKKFIEESNNEENKRAKGPTDRMSVERMCAGPAVPMIYDFMRNKYDNLARVLEEEGKNFNQIDSYHIIKCAMELNDPLCMKVVDKFAEIFGVEAGNFALKTLPHGGIYIIGGVSTGI